METITPTVLTFDLTFSASTLVVFSIFMGEKRAEFWVEGAEPVGDGRGIWMDEVAAMDSWKINHCSSFSSVSLPGCVCVCVCVCVRERERERESVCVCVCVCACQ